MSELYTCISCRVAFGSAEEQRSHFGTDWHRYNMKRRVADLPPVAAATFNEKVLERREQNAIRIDPRSLECTTCRKSFSTENAFRSHVQSKKHRDREAYAAAHPGAESSQQGQDVADHDAQPVEEAEEDEDDADDNKSATDDDEEEEEADFEARIASARRRIRQSDCLFCSQRFEDIEANLRHMNAAHSFFIPHRDELSDLAGLLGHLGEKVVIGNLCLYCPNGGKEFGSLEAVRRHMIDKAHCKVAFESDEDRAELADYYMHNEGSDGDEWEDEEMDEGTNPRGQAALAGDGLSLVLPSGRTLGHRSLKIYYNQNLGGKIPGSDRRTRTDDKVLAVRQRLADPSQALVPIAGGHGAYGRGLEVMRAKNAGEAAWARKQARSHLEQRKREAFRTAVGYKHNSQKHFRDPLLQ